MAARCPLKGPAKHCRAVPQLTSLMLSTRIKQQTQPGRWSPGLLLPSVLLRGSLGLAIPASRGIRRGHQVPDTRTRCDTQGKGGPPGVGIRECALPTRAMLQNKSQAFS